MSLRINSEAPDFIAETTQGVIHFHDWIGQGWAILFSHPKDFTPVCTTELGYMAGLLPQFQLRNTKIIGLSVDPVGNHARWAKDIEETQGHAVTYPMIGDPELKVAMLYDMLPAETGGSAEGRTAADNATVRAVFIIGPDKRIKATLTYPMSTGRNFDEVLRLLDSCQLTAKHSVATPVNWKPGEDVIIPPSISDEAAKQKFPMGWKTLKPYLRVVAQPRDGTGCGSPAAMIFRQMFEPVSGTYTYLLASRRGGEALILDPVLEKVDRYLQLLKDLDLRLVKAVDTHLHADHITGLGALRDRTQCITVMGEQSKVDVVSIRVADGDLLEIEGIALDAIYTPGHTDDSFSFVFRDRVFTGDTLLIRGTGRTDFQNGDPRMQYELLFGRLLKLPDETLVYPAHDYKGDTVSTIGEERAHNPRLQVKSVEEYVDLMNNLRLANPKMMDVAVPANMRQGLVQEQIAKCGWALSAEQAKALIGKSGVAVIDLREKRERERHGEIPGALHLSYQDLQENLSPGGVLRVLGAEPGKLLLFYCAFGERSAMAVRAAQDAGLGGARHIEGGIGAWKSAGGELA